MGEGSMEATKAKVVGPKDGKSGFLGSIGVRFMIDGAETDGGFSLVEHPMSPRALAAPLHMHEREDEYTYVLEGKVGALLGDEVLVAEPGDLVFKPRGQWHTFWNAGDQPARILEIIAPAGFEKFFEELSDMGGAINADPQELTELGERYGQHFKLDSVPGLLERFDLVVGEPLEGGWTPAGS
jgi:mannose-6-phosphate isomerase-like protein (cupin superfamily)